MLGIAQQIYIDKGGVLACNNQPPLWPRLFSALEYVDYALAKHLLANYPHVDESVAALIGYLSMAAREGHLCIRVEGGSITPSPQLLFEGSQVSLMRELAASGVQKLPVDLFTDMSKHASDCPATPICRLGKLFYLQRYWRQETAVIKHFNAIADMTPGIALDMPIVDSMLSKLKSANLLLPEQVDAIHTACNGSLTIICGGPGTGKTYTAGELIKIYWSAMSDEQRRNCQISLAAPTGKAAANLQKSLSRAIGKVAGFPTIHAKTLHSLLGIRGNTFKKEPARLTADLILVDESSMIDVHLMEQLLASIKPGARLILLGDRFQLPPVAAGMVFADLMSQPNGRCIELQKCLRAELKSIVDFAGMINRGDADGAIQLLSSNSGGITLLNFAELSVKSSQKAIVDHAMPFFKDGLNDEPEKALEAFCKFRILCPLRQGPFGVDLLNELFVQRLMSLRKNQEWFVTPILLVSNDHRLELSNGEVGVLVRRMPKDRSDNMLQEGDYALFSGRDDSGEAVRRIPALLLPKYEYAFCLSVHKSQGSEFDRVLLLMPEGAERFGREVLYTAVTRTRKHLEVWGTDDVLRATISQQAHRLSGIPQRL